MQNASLAASMKMAQVIREPMPYGSVLVVDDLETNLCVAKGLMSPYELLVDTAMSGYEAVDKIKRGRVYDIVLMDYMMPGMDGVETAKIMRGLGYKHPIVALTAHAAAGQEEEFLANGFDAFISKPIDLRQLNILLNSLIRDKQPPEVLKAARRQKGGPGTVDCAPSASVVQQLAAAFARDAQKALAALEAISDSAYRDEDMVEYTVAVHAMKGALANIGEAQLSALASQLEQAGEQRNSAVMSAETPAFLDALRALIENISPWEEDAGSGMADEDQAYLREKLRAVQAACAVYDKKVAKDALAELGKKVWSRATQKQLDAIAGRLLHSDFEEAADLAEGSISEFWSS